MVGDRVAKPKADIMTYDQMVHLAEEQRGTSRLYSKLTDSGEKVSAIVSRLSDELSALPDKISLNDTRRVFEVALQYVNACAEVGAIPSKIGCCRAFGCSRQAVDDFMRRHPEHQTTELLSICFDSFAEALNAAGLTGAAHPIVGIFISKALYGWKESVVFETPQAQPLGEEITESEIESKLASDLPFDDE